MDFIDKLNDLKDRVLKLKNQVETEEATKNAFVMPFISALGYDVFNPMEVIPEFTADLGIKKGEKIDYCIKKDDSPIMIIECKHWKEKLDVHRTQLHRYFHVTETKFGVLTNGVVYRFYTDLDEANKMDDKPFLEFSFEKLSDSIGNELKKFQKDIFDVEGIFNNASDLKYSKQIKEMLSRELREPSEDFIKYFASKIYLGRVTQKVLEQFSVLVAKSSKQLISEMINERLQTALNTEPDTIVNDDEPVEIVEETNDNGIITTEEELDGFRIIKAILRKDVDLKRISARDKKSYFGVLLDDNNRKPICRLHFNSSKKYLGLFDENKIEDKIHIEEIDDIYEYAEKLRETIKFYDAE